MKSIYSYNMKVFEIPILQKLSVFISIIKIKIFSYLRWKINLSNSIYSEDMKMSAYVAAGTITVQRFVRS